MKKILTRPIKKELAKRYINDVGDYNFGVFYENEPHNCIAVLSYNDYMPKIQLYSENKTFLMYVVSDVWIDEKIGKQSEQRLINTTIKLLKALTKREAIIIKKC